MAQPLLLARCPTAASVTASASSLGAAAARTSLSLSSIRSQQQQQCSLTRFYRSLHNRGAIQNNVAQRRSSQQPARIPSALLLLPRQTTRPYHSQYHPPLPPHDYTTSQVAILSSALQHVPEHGFTHEALTLGARDAGFLDVSVQLFPRGEMDLVLFWLASRRGMLRGLVEGGLFEKKMTEETTRGGQQAEGEQKKNKRELTVEEKVKILVMERLRMNETIVHRWQDALALMSLPSNIPPSLAELHALSSDILTLAGDVSIDASWYTKRLSLSVVYASAEVVMTQDASPGFRMTQAFVDRRIEDCEAITEKLGGIKQYLGFMASTAVGLGRSWGLKI